MAITVSSRPDALSAAYLPIRYVMTSDKQPNTVAAEINHTVFAIGEVDATLNSYYGNVFEEGDLFVRLQGTITMSLETGEYVKITGTTGAEYDGIHKVKTVYGSSTSGAFTVETTFTESVVGGTCSKYYKDFSIVSDVYLDGAFLVRLRAQVDSNSQFVFDLSRHLQLFVGSDVETLGYASRILAENTSKPFYIKYAEEYRVPDADGNPVIELQSFTDDVSNAKRVVNSCIQYVDYRNKEIVSTNYNMNDFDFAVSTTSTRFLTNMPTEIKIGSNDHLMLGYYETTILGSLQHYYLELYDSNNALISTTDITGSYGVSANGIYNFPAGTDNLSAYITAATVKYKVYRKSNTAYLSEIRTFIIDDDCKPNELQFEWLNSLGGMDAYKFIGQQAKKTTTERKQYKRNLDFPRVIPERQYTTTQNFSTDTFIANSGRVNFETAEWLQELFEDVESYVIIDGQRLPVQILSGSMDVWNSQENSYNISFEYRFAYDKIRQRN